MSGIKKDSKQVDKKFAITLPFFDDESSELLKEMPKLIRGFMLKKQDAIDKFNRLDTVINGGQLTQVGVAFGYPIYTRIDTRDKDTAKYQAERIGKMMGNSWSGNTEEIVLDGKRYTVLLKEQS